MTEENPENCYVRAVPVRRQEAELVDGDGTDERTKIAVSVRHEPSSAKLPERVAIRKGRLRGPRTFPVLRSRASASSAVIRTRSESRTIEPSERA